MKPKQKLFVIKKFVMATSILDALKKEKQAAVEEIWVDDDFKKAPPALSSIGFSRATDAAEK